MAYCIRISKLTYACLPFNRRKLSDLDFFFLEYIYFTFNLQLQLVLMSPDI